MQPELIERIKTLSQQMTGRRERFLADLIRIRSYTGQERAAVDRMLEELVAIGCDDVWMDSAGNALGRIGDGPRAILYDAHLDTNEVADDRDWPHPPCEPVVEGAGSAAVMYGLGASDCKGGVAAIVYGVAILKQLMTETRQVSENLAGLSVVVMGATLEEDAEGFALRSLVERDGLRPEIVLLAEATDLTLRRGQRGRCEIRVRTEGRAAHASQPHLGESALLKMLPVITALEAMNPDLPVDPVFGRGTQVVSLIEGPHTPNSVPAWCEVAVDRRLTPGESAEQVLESIRSVVGPLGASVRIPDQPVLTHTGQRLDGPSFYPGWLLPTDHALLAVGQATHRALWGDDAAVDVWRFSTDGTYSAGMAGIPTLGFGPEEEQYVHTALDQVNLIKLRKASEFYALFPLAYLE
ncbi:MAG: YgeY family selenium metabolism-linked hydrolase [Nitrososphaerales archaeon]